MRRLFGLVCDFALVSPDLPIPKHPGTREIVDCNGQTTTETGARSYNTQTPNVLQAIPPDSILIPSASSLPHAFVGFTRTDDELPNHSCCGSDANNVTDAAHR